MIKRRSTSSGSGGGSDCIPGYSPCLIYHDGADYDCYGGSGNGPYYTAPGVVYRVTGSDPYGLTTGTAAKATRRPLLTVREGNVARLRSERPRTPLHLALSTPSR
jgi:hypothetical protein